MRLRDLGLSLCMDIGSDASESFYDHTAILGRVALHDFVRAGRGVPRGFIEEAGMRFSPRMVDIRQGLGKPIVIVPMGEVPTHVIDVVCRIAWEVFGLPVRILRQRSCWPGAFDPKNLRVDADQVLKLATGLTKLGRVVVITQLELYSSLQKKHVYGYGNMATPVSVSSMFGFGEMGKEHLPWARFVKVVVHEIGHTFGIEHHQKDDNTPCVMNMVPNADGRSGLDFLHHEFCSTCLGDILAGRSQYSKEAKKEEPPCSVQS